LNRIEGNGVRVVLVEDASRFARDLMAQELGIGVLIKLGMRLRAGAKLRTQIRKRRARSSRYPGAGQHRRRELDRKH
jgi:hypothetical protein